ncbi:MerR family transcriptional regulator [Photobacterium sp. TY1-4]|uniref:MerR family transcriptional regulator n=1 Tax=Photobacterium sp. TY1-4 TaxID=2899122 RepID=UPI0021C0F4C5|nr:MerR family transcriptional regulator [Photobacterium sp. TY1-4]UXI04060.1 MerR family transcriptional regulator [Photobacterium sp. TY1-4]
MDCEQAYFAIKEVSELTGVNAVTLRAWQRRYGLLNPMRTEQGHRLYSQADIETIQQIVVWLEKGVAISKVRPLLAEPEANEVTPQADEHKALPLAEVTAALFDCRRKKLDQLLIQLMKEYPSELFLKQVVHPVEQAIQRADNPLAQIQQALWQSVMTERCLALVAQARKRADKSSFLISFEPNVNYRLWIKAWLLAEKGDDVTILPALDSKLLGLGAAMTQLKVESLYVFGEQRISPQAVSQLDALQRHIGCQITLLGSIATIHQHDFSHLSPRSE